jgi:chaperonin cofactor prefoldin
MAFLMWSLPLYKGIIVILVLSLASASGVASYFYDQQGVKVSQASALNNQANQLGGQISALNSEIASLNGQINSLNSQISDLQASNTQLGGTNAQLTSQIQQLETQVSQLQAQVSQLQTQISELMQKLDLEQSSVVASSVCIYSDCPSGNGGNTIGALSFVSLGSILLSGYVRVSWTGADASFSVQVFDVNVTTPVIASGVFSLPVSANATGNAWFTAYDCQPIPSGTYCPPLTYSLTYWY